MKIKKILGSEILDSRGNPTVRVTVQLSGGIQGTASVPSGASTGRHEVLELRDGDIRRYHGKGVLKAVEHVNTTIARAVVGISNQRTLDERMCELDGTGNKKRLGANAILGVSLAYAHAVAHARKIPLYRLIRELSGMKTRGYTLPLPMMNIENGGAHAGWILDFQEYMIVPQQSLFRDRVRCGSEIFHVLGALLKKRGYSTLVGDEGGYAIPFRKNEDAFKAIMAAIGQTRYAAGKDVMLAMDPATSELYDPKKAIYILKKDKKKLSSNQMIALWKSWIRKYPIVSIEDGLAEDDWTGWKNITAQLGNNILLVGDDFFVTNAKRLKRGIDMGAANAILIKPNQIGTLSETLDCIALARAHAYTVIISHRSAETADTTIADLAVGINAEYIKTGSVSRSERVEKYNRLMEIERELL
jgi:enolase